MSAAATTKRTPIWVSSAWRRGETEARHTSAAELGGCGGIGVASLLSMIRMVTEYGVGAIKLLGEHDPHQRVRQREARQRPGEIGPRPHRWRKAIGPADQQREVAAVAPARLQEAGKLARRELPAALIERHDIILVRDSRE